MPEFDEDYGQGRFPKLITFRVDEIQQRRIKQDAEYHKLSISEFCRKSLTQRLPDAKSHSRPSLTFRIESHDGRTFELNSDGRYREVMADSESERAACSRCGDMEVLSER